MASFQHRIATVKHALPYGFLLFILLVSPARQTSAIPHYLPAEAPQSLAAAYAWQGVEQVPVVTNSSRTSLFSGFDLAREGDTLVVGSQRPEAALVYTRTDTGWLQIKTLVPDDPPTSGYTDFGLQVAIHDDIIAVGAPDAAVGDRRYRGAVYLYARDAGGPGNWGQVAKIAEPSGAIYTRFGATIAMSDDLLLIGAPHRSYGGVVHIYAPDTGDLRSWSKQGALAADDGALDDYFGAALVLNGDTIAVGAPKSATINRTSGAVYLFERTTGTNLWTQIARRVPSDTFAGDAFGRTLALHEGLLLVGYGVGGAALFGRDQGGADQWGEITRLTAPKSGDSGDFGASVAISQGRLYIGAPRVQVAQNTPQGAVFVFEPSPSAPDQWVDLAAITAPPGAPEEVFGTYTTILDGELISTAHGDRAGLFRTSFYTHRLVRRPLPADDRAQTVEDQPVLIDVLANDSAPPDAGALDPGAVVIVENPTKGSTSVDPSSGVVTYTPNLHFFGEDSFRYQVRTTAGSTQVAAVTVTVDPVPDPPRFTGTPPTTGRVGTLYSATISASDPDPGDQLRILAPILPPWLSVTDAGNGSATLSGTPQNQDVGPQLIELQVVDSTGLSATQQLTIDVAPNRPAVLTHNLADTVREGRTYAAVISATDPDPGQALQLAAPTLPAWLTFNVIDPGRAEISGTPRAADVGTHTVRLTATDSGGLEVSQTVTITVAPDLPNPPSNLIAVPNGLTGVRLQWQDTSRDELGFLVEYRMGEEPWQVLAQLPANTVAYEHTGLPCGVSSTYRVSAYHDRWSSLPSTTATAAPELLTQRSFLYTGMPVPVSADKPVLITLPVIAGGTLVDVNVHLDIDTIYAGDLGIRLVSPSGIPVDLSLGNGGGGWHYRGTLFDDEAEQSITAGYPPFSGSYRPQQPLSRLDGGLVGGLWTLLVVNDGSPYDVLFKGFGLEFTVPDGCPGVPSTPTTQPTDIPTPTGTATNTPTPTSTATATSTPTPRPPTLLFVDARAAGSGSGRSWIDAFPDLQSALRSAQTGDVLWIAAGTYRPAADTNRDERFRIPPGVAVYGGFRGDETALEQRNWQTNATILSGDIGSAGVADDNSRVVVELINGRQDTILDGVTVVAGVTGISIQGGEPTLRNLVVRDHQGSSGSGMTVVRSAPRISDVLFTGNTASVDGGGLNVTTQSAVVLERTRFADNQGLRGGGLAVSNSRLTLRDVIFENNSSTHGGALYSRNATLTVEGGRFAANRATGDGGALYQYLGSVTLLDLVFEGNSAINKGGAASLSGGRATLEQVRFIDNETTHPSGKGGALASDNDAGTRIVGATFAGNRAAYRGGAIYVDLLSSLTLINAVLTGNTAIAESGGGIYSCGIFSVVNSTIVGNDAAMQGGGIYNCWSGSAVHNSILWQNTAGGASSQIHSTVSPPIDVRFSMVDGGFTGAGNLNGDPRFVQAAGPDGQFGTADDDLRLAAGSPAIDAGDSTLVPPGVIADLDGNQRRSDDPASPDSGTGAPVVDMGAYERLASVAPTRTAIPTLTPTPTSTPTPTRTSAPTRVPPTPTPTLPLLVTITTQQDTGDGRLDEGERVTVPVTQIVLQFNRNITTYRSTAIFLIGEGAVPGIQSSSCAALDGRDTIFRSNFLSYQYPTQSIVLGFATASGTTSLADGYYRLIVCDTIPGGYPLLDGDGDGSPGGDFVRNFSVENMGPLPPLTTATSTATPTSTAAGTPTATGTATPTAIATATATATAAGMPTATTTATTATPPAPELVLRSDEPTGKPGSAFLVAGRILTPGARVELQINGRVVGTVRANNRGQFQVVLQTDPDALPGQYRITVTEAQLSSEPAPAVIYTLGAEYPLRTVAPNEASLIQVPAGIPSLLRTNLWLPLVSQP